MVRASSFIREAPVTPEVLKKAARNVLALAVECDRLTQEELDEISGSTFESLSKKSLEKLATVALWAGRALHAESIRR